MARAWVPHMFFLTQTGRTTMLKKCFVLCGTALFIGCNAEAGPSIGWKYSIVDMSARQLGTLGGAESEARDINDHGEIVGWADNTVTRRAFLYRAGAMEDITYGDLLSAEANGINNSTQIVGVYKLEGFDRPHAFYYDDTHPIEPLDETNLADPELPTASRAYAINDSGVIAGQRMVAWGNLYSIFAATWHDYGKQPEDLMPNHPPGGTYAHNINAAGVIVGTDTVIDGTYYWWEGVEYALKAAWAPAPGHFLGLSGGSYGINTAGKIVGEQLFFPTDDSTGKPLLRATFWSGGSARPFGLDIFSDGQNSHANEINDDDFVVGWGDRDIPNKGLQHRAALWHSDLGIVELPAPAFYSGRTAVMPSSCEASAVNQLNPANGLIQAVGFCVYDGKSKAILWNILVTKVALTPGEPAPVR